MTAMKTAREVTWYGQYITGAWPKAWGVKPGADVFSTAACFCVRPGKHAFALAMYLRAGGATDKQVTESLGQTPNQNLHNQKNNLVKAGYLARVGTGEGGAVEPGVYAYTVTKAGLAFIKRRQAMLDAADKVALPSQKPKVVKVKAAATEPDHKPADKPAKAPRVRKPKADKTAPAGNPEANGATEPLAMMPAPDAGESTGATLN